jgi:hypothetical protein
VRACALIGSSPRTSMRTAAIALDKGKVRASPMVQGKRFSGRSRPKPRLGRASKRKSRFRMKDRTVSSFSRV